MRVCTTFRRLAWLLGGLSACADDGGGQAGSTAGGEGSTAGATTGEASGSTTDTGGGAGVGSDSGSSSSGEVANVSPFASDDYQLARTGEVLEVAGADGLLVNDGDEDGDDIWVNDAPLVTWLGGEVAVAQDGSFSYTPPDAFGGCDGFEYGVTDGRGGVAQAVVHLAVEHPWHRPSPVRLARVADGWGGLAIEGEGQGDRSGLSVAIAGDVDGNAVPDVMIGAPPSDRVYVAFGLLAEEPVDLVNITNGLGGFRIDGEAEGVEAGNAVAGAGDIDDDGRADLVVGAWRTGFDAPGGELVGRVYVVFGKPDAEAVSLANVTDGWGGYAITGAASSDFAGAAVDGGGDVDGDGTPDVIIGAPSSDPNGPESGRAYVVFGKVDTAPVSLADVEAGVGGFAIEGEQPLDAAGHAVANAGDWNGDGLADVVVGTGETADLRGRVYLVLGKSDGERVELSEVAQGVGGFALEGENEGDHAGASVAGLGDVNGDALDDFAFSAYGADGFRGRTYVVFGRDDDVTPTLSDLVVDGGLVIEGEHADDFSGAALSRAGDMNGDGLADLAIGAWRAGSDVPLSGRAYVVFGRAEAGSVELAEVGNGLGGFAIEGETANSFAGRALAGGGDVDGDGVDDLVVGAYGANDYAGRTYVVHGGELVCPVD